MHALRRLPFAILTIAAAAMSSSCFAITDLDRFQQKSATLTNFNGLKLTVRGMTSHVAELFEYRIVDATNTLQSRGFITPLGGVEATLFAPNAVPKQNGPFTLDFYADHDHSGGYGGPADGTGDHSWRLPLRDDMIDEDGNYPIVFDHNTSFSLLANPAPPREIGLPATVRLNDMGEFVGKRVQVRIADASSQRVVALYRVPALGAPAYSFTIAGMIEAGVTYAVEVYTDNGQTPPGAVVAFRATVPSSRAGLDFDFDPKVVARVGDAPSP